MFDATLDKLRGAVEEMDSTAQTGFSEIAAIARLALAAMENPNTCRDIEIFARAFEAIADKAAVTEIDVNYMAESVGCSSVDRAMRRRLDARRQAHEQIFG